jgi:putative sigma-54 modulation protein
MHVTVTGRHFEITDPLRQHIESKLNKLDRYLDGITDVHVVLSVENTAILLRLISRRMVV